MGPKRGKRKLSSDAQAAKKQPEQKKKSIGDTTHTSCTVEMTSLDRSAAENDTSKEVGGMEALSQETSASVSSEPPSLVPEETPGADGHGDPEQLIGKEPINPKAEVPHNGSDEEKGEGVGDKKTHIALEGSGDEKGERDMAVTRGDEKEKDEEKNKKDKENEEKEGSVKADHSQPADNSLKGNEIDEKGDANEDSGRDKAEEKSPQNEMTINSGGDASGFSTLITADDEVKASQESDAVQKSQGESKLLPEHKSSQERISAKDTKSRNGEEEDMNAVQNSQGESKLLPKYKSSKETVSAKDTENRNGGEEDMKSFQESKSEPGKDCNKDKLNAAAEMSSTETPMDAPDNSVTEKPKDAITGATVLPPEGSNICLKVDDKEPSLTVNTNTDKANDDKEEPKKSLQEASAIEDLSDCKPTNDVSEPVLLDNNVETSSNLKEDTDALLLPQKDCTVSEDASKEQEEKTSKQVFEKELEGHDNHKVERGDMKTDAEMGGIIIEQAKEVEGVGLKDAGAELKVHAEEKLLDTMPIEDPAMDGGAFDTDMTESQLCAISDDIMEEQEEMAMAAEEESRRQRQEEGDRTVNTVLQSLIKLNDMVNKTRGEMETVKRRYQQGAAATRRS